MSIVAQALRMKYDKIILPSKKELPEIIRNYEENGLRSSGFEFEIITRYHKQMQKLELIVENFLTELENIDEE